MHPLDQIGLHGWKAGGANDAEGERGGKMLATFRRVSERVSTCGVISVPPVSSLLQHVVRCSEKYAYVYLINYTLCGTLEYSRFVDFNVTSPDSNIIGNHRVTPK